MVATQFIVEDIQMSDVNKTGRNKKDRSMRMWRSLMFATTRLARLAQWVFKFVTSKENTAAWRTGLIISAIVFGLWNRVQDYRTFDLRAEITRLESQQAIVTQANQKYAEDTVKINLRIDDCEKTKKESDERFKQITDKAKRLKKSRTRDDIINLSTGKQTGAVQATEATAVDPLQLYNDHSGPRVNDYRRNF